MVENSRHSKLDRQQVETILGNLLRTGVIVSAVVVANRSGDIFVSPSERACPITTIFKGEPTDLRSVGGIIKDALALSGRGIIQLGLLLLIATPVMRVLISIVVFVKQGDRKYMVITVAVLVILIYSLMWTQ